MKNVIKNEMIEILYKDEVRRVAVFVNGLGYIRVDKDFLITTLELDENPYKLFTYEFSEVKGAIYIESIN